MRNYYYFNQFLDELKQDIYDQPDDEGHTQMAVDIIDKWIPSLGIKSVVDMGCGTGFCYQIFSKYLSDYIGVEIGLYDELESELVKPLIFKVDFTFSGFPNNFADLVFSRHTLEHSPFPLITLMEWHRVARKYLLLVLPNPGYYTYVGRNHYSVMNIRQIRWLLRRAGWEIRERDYSEPTELRFLCEKRDRVGVEGYIEVLTNDILEADQKGL